MIMQGRSEKRRDVNEVDGDDQNRPDDDDVVEGLALGEGCWVPGLNGEVREYVSLPPDPCCSFRRFSIPSFHCLLVTNTFHARSNSRRFARNSTHESFVPIRQDSFTKQNVVQFRFNCHNRSMIS